MVVVTVACVNLPKMTWITAVWQHRGYVLFNQFISTVFFTSSALALRHMAVVRN